MYRPWRFECELRQLIRAFQSDPELSKILEDGYYQRRIGQVVTEIDGLKGLVEAVVDRLMTGQPVGATGSLNKLYWSECHQAFAGLAMDMVSRIHLASSPLARRAQKHFTTAYLFARAETIYAGVTEVQLDIIAQRILKLPKDIQK